MGFPLVDQGQIAKEDTILIGADGHFKIPPCGQVLFPHPPNSLGALGEP